MIAWCWRRKLKEGGGQYSCIIKKLNDKKTKIMTSFSKLINGTKPVLVDFFAEWCGPCKMMAPILKQAKDELGDSTTIIKIDIDKNQKLAQQFQVMSVPTLMLFKNGKMEWKHSGVLYKDDIVRTIEQYK